MQLVFGRDAILNVKHVTNWTYIKERKQRMIRKNNQRENSKRKAHTYAEGDLVLIKNNPNKAKFDDEWLGPVPVVGLHDNGVIRYRKGQIEDSINIRQVHPYRTPVVHV
jgi:hypothetical protein